MHLVTCRARAQKSEYTSPRANGAERRSGRQPGVRLLIPPGYLHPGKGKHYPSLKFINERGRRSPTVGGHA
jgi:hypothetical protein